MKDRMTFEQLNLIAMTLQNISNKLSILGCTIDDDTEKQMEEIDLQHVEYLKDHLKHTKEYFTDFN